MVVGSSKKEDYRNYIIKTKGVGRYWAERRNSGTTIALRVQDFNTGPKTSRRMTFVSRNGHNDHGHKLLADRKSPSHCAKVIQCK